MTLFSQLVTYSGASVFYVASDTYPSSAYYEYKVDSTPGNNGVVYIPGTGQEESIYFCNIQGTNQTESNVTVGLKPGGEWSRDCGSVCYTFSSLSVL